VVTILIAGIVLVALFAAAAAYGVRRRGNPYAHLRAQALTSDAATLGIAPSDDVWGVLMDLPISGVIATVVAFADGSASIYLSSGGGFIGGGHKPPIQRAARAFVAAAGAARALLAPTATFPTSDAGSVRFYARTRGGVLGADAPEQALASGRHALSPLFMAGQGVISAYREDQTGKN